MTGNSGGCNTNMAIAEGAQHLGFAEGAYFTRVFTRRAGGRSSRMFRPD
jgi:hypothetical protein